MPAAAGMAVGNVNPVYTECLILQHVQKNNCLGMSAEQPKLPDVQPMSSFQVHACGRIAHVHSSGRIF